ncbi:hypothetical protein [Sphingomonas lycopersici]|uniref:Uncharacterized protein n=1 Tax=Sphingomonas lycopersici TaxID=2951807 RepID=A0AA42CRC3_9SPHN|nr:hypothetical protein [Sphingomonas lycopersici]MCW6535937.1 hypothetical protein [Sphingomonas lycopersici]
MAEIVRNPASDIAPQAQSILMVIAQELETNIKATARLAIAIWLIGPLPMLLANHLFIKIDPMVTASHAVAGS